MYREITSQNYSEGIGRFVVNHKIPENRDINREIPLDKEEESKLYGFKGISDYIRNLPFSEDENSLGNKLINCFNVPESQKKPNQNFIKECQNNISNDSQNSNGANNFRNLLNATSQQTLVKNNINNNKKGKGKVKLETKLRKVRRPMYNYVKVYQNGEIIHEEEAFEVGKLESDRQNTNYIGLGLVSQKEMNLITQKILVTVRSNFQENFFKIEQIGDLNISNEKNKIIFLVVPTSVSNDMIVGKYYQIAFIKEKLKFNKEYCYLIIDNVKELNSTVIIK